jgi:hypothetical protein
MENILLPIVGGCVHTALVPSVVYGFLGYARNADPSAGSSKVWGLADRQAEAEDNDLPYDDEVDSGYSASELSVSDSSSGASSERSFRNRSGRQRPSVRAPDHAELMAAAPPYIHPVNRRYDQSPHFRTQPDRRFAPLPQNHPARRAATETKPPPPLPVSRRPAARHPLERPRCHSNIGAAELSMDAFIGSPVSSDTELDDEYPWAYDRLGRRRV